MVKKLDFWVFEMKPGVPRRHLLLVAASVWLFAGGFLTYRGIHMFQAGMDYGVLKLMGTVVSGLLFFHLFFLRISLRHITRIRSLEILRPCIFSFFNWRSYLLMATMITSGILLRKSGWIDQQWIALFFIAMAIPLLLSAVRFFKAWMKYNEIAK